IESVYEKNDLNLARSDQELAVGIRALVGKSLSFVTTNEAASLAESARQAVALARLSPPDEHNALPERSDLVANARNGTWDPALQDMGPDALTMRTCELVERIHAKAPHGVQLAIDQVRLSAEESVEAIASSSGVRAGMHATYLSGFVMGMAKQGEAVGSFTYDGAAGNGRQEVEAELALAIDRFVDKALGALGPHKGRSFKGTILLTPDAVGEILVGPLLEAIGADAVRKGRSPLGAKEGQAIAAACFTMRDPGERLGMFSGRPFDREGQPVQAVELVSGGRLRTFLFDSYEARMTGRRSTGHAQGGATSPPRPGSALVEVLPGARAAAEMERSLEMALLVPRFSGRVEMATGDFSGVVKGGFLVERGERIPVTETMIAGNLYDALRHIAEVSSDRLQLFGTSCFPTIAVEGVTVTAG
ncbi:MAG: TldD/PmbA family protein, partial [Cyanobacteria bacterium REEB65]|nr:TldD/PmbA family protein [Cyanobacteria bacterium REEB65]